MHGIYIAQILIKEMSEYLKKELGVNYPALFSNYFCEYSIAAAIKPLNNG